VITSVHYFALEPFPAAFELVSLDFSNLSRGVICAPTGARLTRIESTALEQHLWSRVVWGAGPELLTALGSGTQVVLHDHSERKRLTRAQWMGLPWLMYAMTRALPGVKEVSSRIWKRDGQVGMDVSDMFKGAWRSLDKSTRRWLQYFAHATPSAKPCLCRLKEKA
jgi:hypothetical protein